MEVTRKNISTHWQHGELQFWANCFTCYSEPRAPDAQGNVATHYRTEHANHLTVPYPSNRLVQAICITDLIQGRVDYKQEKLSTGCLHLVHWYCCTDIYFMWKRHVEMSSRTCHRVNLNYERFDLCSIYAITPIIESGMKLTVHSKTSTVHEWRFRNEKKITPHFLVHRISYSSWE